MSARSATSREVHFAAPRGGASRGLLWYGLIAPPLVWAAELYLNYGLASHACFAGQAPRASFLSGWERVWVALLVGEFRLPGRRRDRSRHIGDFLAPLAGRHSRSTGKPAGSPILRAGG